MEYIALLSGGKDSVLALDLSMEKYNVEKIVTMIPRNKESYMFHTPALEIINEVGEAISIPLLTVGTLGEKEKEVDDLHEVIKKLKPKGIIAGAIASKYQKVRLQKICDKENIKLITPLWHKDPHWVIKTLLSRGYRVIFVGVAAMGLTKEWLGREIDSDSYKELLKIEEKFQINIAGEGGEFETLVLDCPIYKSKINILEKEIHWDRTNGWLEIKKVELEKKRKLLKNDFNDYYL
ncbi:MAG: diphthine--ammonia ligase [Candidatus Ranarchaeia archaeon]